MGFGIITAIVTFVFGYAFFIKLEKLSYYINLKKGLRLTIVRLYSMLIVICIIYSVFQAINVYQYEVKKDGLSNTEMNLSVCKDTKWRSIFTCKGLDEEEYKEYKGKYEHHKKLN